MSESLSTVNTSAEKFEDGENSLIALLIVFAKRKKLLIGLPIVAGVVAAGLALLMPNIYSASTTMLPPQQAQSTAGALLSQLGGAAGMAGGLAGLKNPNDMYVGMLRSRTVADKLIERFNLKNVYETPSPEKARKALAGNTIISSGKDGLITVSVEDKDKKLVAPIANAYVAELVKLTKVLAVTEAARRRLFYEGQLEAAKDKLASAEMSLKSRLESGGVVSVDSDSRVFVETIGRLRAQVSAKEIQLGSMQAFVTASNPEYRQVQEELNSLRSELARLEGGRAADKPGPERSGTTQAGLENVKILRDVKYFQMLYELLAKQYEIARLDEAKDSSIIQVLDSAVEPENKTKPGRAVIVLLTVAMSFFVACAIALLLEFKAGLLRLPEYAAQWSRLKSHLRFR